MPDDFLSNRREVWLLDRVARAYGVLPSALIGLNDPHPPTPSPLRSEGESKSPLHATGFRGGDWLTYTFDRAVWLWGQWVEAKLGERDAQGRAVWSLERLLREAGPIARSENLGGADQLMALVGEAARFKP